ncbi:MAG: hypothetical protein ACYTEX_27085 [Planctomycetota bacterium]|jgi:hypothetical protein
MNVTKIILVTAVGLVGTGASGACQAAVAPAIQWGKDARSAVLDVNELGRMRAVFPAWKVKQSVWPSEEEVTSNTVEASAKEKASCVNWLRRFIREDQLPVGLDKHLVAMKNWGLIKKQSEQKRLCDVFIVRFRKGPYVLHMQESPYNIVLAVSDERLAKNSRSDHTKLVIQTGTRLLNEALKPDPNSDSFHVRGYGAESDSDQISSVTWGIDSVVTIDRAGRRALDLAKAGKVGTTHVHAETDGRLVKFEMIKCPGAVKAAFFDPYVERFKLRKSKSGAPGAKDK